MSSSSGIDAEELAFPTSSNYSHVYEKVVDTTNGSSHNEKTTDHRGETLPVTQDENIYYDETGSLFNQPLILVKDIKSPFDIRYKTDYFPRGGKHANVPQKPRYLHTVDDEQEISIKFPDGYKVPRRPGYYSVEVALVTVPRINKHHMHVNKFQLHHKDINVLDQNVFFIYLTPEHFINGEIRIKLVLIKTRNNELKNIAFLPLFGEQTPSDWTADCESVEDLKDTYELNYARIAFSLGYTNTNNEFIRFTNTTVFSNEIMEQVKPKSAGDVTCPNCSHRFRIQEQKEKGKKRSASSCNSTEKKRSSQ